MFTHKTDDQKKSAGVKILPEKKRKPIQFKDLNNVGKHKSYHLSSSSYSNMLFLLDDGEDM